MALKREDALKIIVERITWLVTICDVRGVLHLFDVHTLSHEFFCRLLNEVYDLNLVVMDRIQANFPAIDLGDVTNKRSFQITAENSSKKIQTTLIKYASHGLAEQYGKLQIVVIGNRQRTYTGLAVPTGLAFVPDDDILDIPRVLKVIEGLPTAKLQRIALIVQQEIKVVELPGELHLHVSVHNEPRDNWYFGDDTRLTYVAELVDDMVDLKPSMAYLTTVAAGGPIEPLQYLTPTCGPFEWDFPALDFKLLNRSSDHFLLAEAIFDVEESVLDPRPVVAVKEDMQRAFAGSFWLMNEGATSLEDVRVRYELMHGNVPAPPVFPSDYRFGCQIPLWEDALQIYVESSLEKCGVNYDELNRLLNIADNDRDKIVVYSQDGSKIAMTREEHWAAITHNFGPFKDGIATVAGELNFKSPAGKDRTNIRFRAVVYILSENRRRLPRPPSFIYDVELEVSGSNYRKTVPMSQELKPGEADRFLIKVGARQPSVHKCRVTFKDVGGHIIQSSWIHLRCFVPRSRPRHLDGPEAMATKP